VAKHPRGGDRRAAGHWHGCRRIRPDAGGAQGIVAVANDQPITERDISQRIELRKMLGDLPSGGMTRKQALQNLIDDQVKLLEAKRLMLVPSDAEISDR
jgi:peptidyl-prolyl cis-trans isomerase SurA